MLEELEQALIQFDASRHPMLHDHFHYRIKTFRDWQQAFTNSLRASVTIFGSGVIWVTTSWSAGLTFMMFVSIVCSLFSTLEKPALATRAFLGGAIIASFVAGILVLWRLAEPLRMKSWPSVCSCPCWRVGWPLPTALVLGAVSYNLFLPILLGPGNQSRLDEVTFFNTAMPLVLALCTRCGPSGWCCPSIRMTCAGRCVPASCAAALCRAQPYPAHYAVCGRA